MLPVPEARGWREAQSGFGQPAWPTGPHCRRRRPGAARRARTHGAGPNKRPPRPAARGEQHLRRPAAGGGCPRHPTPQTPGPRCAPHHGPRPHPPRWHHLATAAQAAELPSGAATEASAGATTAAPPYVGVASSPLSALLASNDAATSTRAHTSTPPDSIPGPAPLISTYATAITPSRVASTAGAPSQSLAAASPAPPSPVLPSTAPLPGAPSSVSILGLASAASGPSETSPPSIPGRAAPAPGLASPGSISSIRSAAPAGRTSACRAREATPSMRELSAASSSHSRATNAPSNGGGDSAASAPPAAVNTPGPFADCGVVAERARDSSGRAPTAPAIKEPIAVGAPLQKGSALVRRPAAAVPAFVVWRASASSQPAVSSVPASLARLIVFPPRSGLRASAIPEGASAALSSDTDTEERCSTPRGESSLKLEKYTKLAPAIVSALAPTTVPSHPTPEEPPPPQAAVATGAPAYSTNQRRLRPERWSRFLRSQPQRRTLGKWAGRLSVLATWRTGATP
eukprot:scaffold4963_cov97-Isochrysis_galbana.AAC.4